MRLYILEGGAIGGLLAILGHIRPVAVIAGADRIGISVFQQWIKSGVNKKQPSVRSANFRIRLRGWLRAADSGLSGLENLVRSIRQLSDLLAGDAKKHSESALRPTSGHANFFGPGFMLVFARCGLSTKSRLHGMNDGVPMAGSV